MQQQTVVFAVLGALAIALHQSLSTSDAIGQDILGFADLIGGLQDYFLSIGNTTIVTGGITELTTPDTTQTTTTHIDVVHNALEKARTSDLTTEGSNRRRKRYNSIWFHYAAIPKLLLAPGTFVTNRILPYWEAYTMTFIDADEIQADGTLWVHTITANTSELTPPTEIRPGVLQTQILGAKRPHAITPLARPRPVPLDINF